MITDVCDRIRAARSVLFVLDYDGTLTPIVPRPEAALLAESTRSLLRDLQSCATVAIVSGRSLDDLVERMGLDPSFTYAGNHGLEIKGPGFSFHPDGAAESADQIQAILKTVRPLLETIPGVIIEDKRFTASFHYRLASGEAEALIREILNRHKGASMELRHGKKVIELRPLINWNKGRAARWIIDNHAQGALPICFGDDTTDEDMFTVLAHGITIRVGYCDNTAARYNVANVEEVIDLLRRFKACLSDCDRDQTPH